MADLSARLPTEIDSQQRYIAPAPPAPSIWESLADFGSNAIGVADNVISALDRRKVNKQKAGDLAAQNATAKTFYSINGPQEQASPAPALVTQTETSDPNHNAAVAATKAAAPQMLNNQTAGQQGAIDPSMVQARNVAAIRQLMAQFPGHEAVIATAARELGVQNMLTQQYANAETALEDNQKAERDAIHTLEKKAVTEYGFPDYYQRTPPEQAIIRAQVASWELANTELEAKSKQADLMLKNVQAGTEQAKGLQTQVSSDLAQSLSNALTKGFSMANLALMNQLTDPALANDPARAEALQSKLLSTVIPGLKQQYAQTVAPYAFRLTPDDRTALDKMFSDQIESLTGMLTGPQSIVETNTRMMKELAAKSGIDFAKAAPTLYKLQKIVGPQTLGTLFLPSLQAGGPLAKQLTEEMQRAVNSGSDTDVLSVASLLQTLQGDKDVQSLDPNELRKKAPQYLESMVNLSKNIPATNGTDQDAHRALVNSIKITSGIAADVNVGWGFNNILNQTEQLTSRGVNRALLQTTQNRVERTDAIQSYMPALVRSYQALARSDSGDSYYKPQFDSHTLQWSLKWNGQMKVGPNSRAIPAGVDPTVAQLSGVGDRYKPSPTSAALRQVAALNNSLNNLSSAAAHGWSATLPKGTTYQEARRFYSTGDMPASMTQATSKSKNGKTPEQNVEDTVSHILDYVNHLQFGSGPGAAVVKAGNIGPSPLAPAIATSAEKYNVPPAIAASLFHTESSGGKNPATSSKGATGPGQIMPATAALYGMDVKTMTPEQNVDLALRILSDNYKKTGNWQDALSMYHSGVPLAKAIKEGRTDGNMTTSDYVSSTMAAASSISPENLKRYGYVRY
jgi:hypothetical protein